MTVKDVIEQLSKYPQDKVVKVTDNWGWNYDILCIYNSDDIDAIIIDGDFDL